jgi:hypothetical protein
VKRADNANSASQPFLVDAALRLSGDKTFAIISVAKVLSPWRLSEKHNS